jgi:hypothetical protein
LYPTFFSFDKSNDRLRENAIIPDSHGEIRDMKWLHTAKLGDILMAGRNNDSLLFYKLNK